jgi:hypothetical protein
MMTNIRNFAAIATSLLVLSSAGAAFAQQQDAPQSITLPWHNEPKNSINLGLGTVWGSPSLSYEHLFAGGHGLVIGANGFFARHDIGNAMGAGGSIGYRYHWHERQDSVLFGIHAGFDRDQTPMRITENEMTTDTVVDMTTFYLVGNLGKRWVLGDNINITARIGGGLALRRLDSDAEDYDPLVGFVHGMIESVPVTLDGELSVGYMF